MNERDIPSVPITTLAGVASLTDLLPVLPLPTPLPSTINNKSQLFHPRVAEEAAILLATRDDNLVSLLLQSLMQTSVEHIELKDDLPQPETATVQQQQTPELLKAIIQANPSVFDRTQRWNNHNFTPKYNGLSPAGSYQGYSPHGMVQVSPSTHGALHPAHMQSPSMAQQGQPSPHVNMASPPSQTRPNQIPPNAQNHLSPQWDATAPSNNYSMSHNVSMEDVLNNDIIQRNGSLYNSIISENRNDYNNQMDINEKDPLAVTTTNQQGQMLQPHEKAMLQPGNVMTNQSPAQASIAPSPLRQELQAPQPAMGTLQHQNNLIQPTLDNNRNSFIDMKQPIVRLGRLSEGVLSKHSINDSVMSKSSNAGSDSDDNLPLKNKNTVPVDKEREAIDIARERNWQAVKRKHEEASKAEEVAAAAIVKPKLRKVERRLVPVIEMLSIDELMETNSYQRFTRLIDNLFETIDDDIVITDDMGGTDIPEEMLISHHKLQELCAEAAKLKTLAAMEAIPSDRLIRLLNLLEKNLRASDKLSPFNEAEDTDDVWSESVRDRIRCGWSAALAALHILTAPALPKRLLLEDLIDHILLFVKFQLNNTIYCAYDPVYSSNTSSKKKDGRKRKSTISHGTGREARSVRESYSSAVETVSLLAELVSGNATLTDTSVLHATSLAVSPFFVENVSELQLAALKLVTTIFTKYEQHRRLLLEDILASIARIPSTKHNLRTYQLNSEQHIQMLTALVLQLVQCVVQLPDHFNNKDKEKKLDSENCNSKKNVDKDAMILTKYESAVSIGGTFLTSFLNKCRSRTEEVDFRPLFENFVQDLLITVNKPEWPATELLLSLLGTMLVKYMSDKTMEMSVRVASLEYLGLVASRLRKDAVTSRAKLSTMDTIIKDIKAEEEKDGVEDDDNHHIDSDEERTEFLQRVLLDYLAVNGQKDQAWNCARHFYITQWYRDTIVQPKSTSPTKKSKSKSKKKYKDESSEDEKSDSEDEEDKRHDKKEMSSVEKLKLQERRKAFLLDKIRPFRYKGGAQVQVMQSYIDYSGAELISQYLASKRSFSQSFDKYLRKILVILCENTIACRTKAMKCLAMIVEADPSVLARSDMQIGVNRSFLDQSTAVREAAVDLVGKFVLSRPDLIDKYYTMLSNRILDTGVSVRKRVIKILKDICIECPEFPKIPEICVKMIRRVNDEEGIRKLVMEVFQNMWFTPCPVSSSSSRRSIMDAASDPLSRKVLNITDVVLSSRDIGLEWFQQLLQSLFKPKEDKDDSTKIIFTPPKSLLLACQQIVDCLIENILQIEESNTDGQGTSQRLVACLSTLHLFAKIRPQLLVNHAIMLQPYLSLKCQGINEQQMVCNVAGTLELVVPLMEHPSDSFLAALEEDVVKLILQHGQQVIASCLACLGAVVNTVTKNYKLVRDVFNKYLGVLLQWKRGCEINHESVRAANKRPQFRRALYIVGLLLRHFDFTDTKVIEGLPPDIKEQVYTTLMYFLQMEDEDFRAHTLKAMGSVCVRHYEFMLRPELKELYHILLTGIAAVEMKADVLRNIELYLLEEEQRMIRQDKEWSKRSKQENLKEMGDVSSGMASTIIQLYLKEVLGSFLHRSPTVRCAAMKCVQLVLAQGLVHPVQIVPYLICMSTDTEVTVSHTADKHLQEIDKKYPGFIHMKSQLGIKLTFELQKILQMNSSDGVIRGFRLKDQDEMPSALNGYLYSLLRSTRPQRRALALSLLKQYDDTSSVPLEQLLYLADNMAYFPYQVQDEPLFILHNIDIIISTSGSNLLQLFREGLLGTNTTAGETEEEDDDEDAASLLARLPDNTRPLVDIMLQAQGCLLLLVLRQHLKHTYHLTDAKVSQYSPSENVKVYEKAVSRRNNSKFQPKATICKILEPETDEEQDETVRKKLIDEYLEFKQLMLKFDPEEEDDDELGPSTSTTQPTTTQPATNTSTENSSSKDTSVVVDT